STRANSCRDSPSRKLRASRKIIQTKKAPLALDRRAGPLKFTLVVMLPVGGLSEVLHLGLARLVDTEWVACQRVACGGIGPGTRAAADQPEGAVATLAGQLIRVAQRAQHGAVAVDRDQAVAADIAH